MLNTRAIGSGALLLSLGTGISAVIKFISVPIIARLLTPEEFGIAGTALVLVGFATVLGAGNGLGTAVTYFKEEREYYDHTTFTLALLISLLMAPLCWFFSAALAQFWGAPEAESLIKIVAVFLPFSILTGVGFALLARDMNFRLITLTNIIASIFSTGTAIGMAYHGYGALSLVAQYAVFNLIKCVGFFGISGYRPRLDIDSTRLKDILPFAYKLTFSDILIWVSGEGPFVLITRILGVEAGGVQRMYQRFTALPREVIGENLRQAAFVGISGRPEDEMKAGFLWATRMLTYTLGAVFCWMAAVSEPLTELILGPRFAPYWPLTIIFSLGLVAQTISSMALPYFKAKGGTGTILVLSLLRALLIVGGTFVGLRVSNSMTGAALGIASGMALASGMFLALMLKREGILTSALMQSIFLPLLPVLGTGLAVFALSRNLYGEVSNIINVSLCSALGAILYILLIRLFMPADFRVLSAQIRKLAKRKKS